MMTSRELLEMGYTVGADNVARKRTATPEDRRFRPFTIRFFVDHTLRSEANAHDALRSKLQRRAALKAAVSNAMTEHASGLHAVGEPSRVTFAWLYEKPMDSHDNLRMALKTAVDVIANYMNFDDAADVWSYEQQKRAHYETAGFWVKIEFRARKKSAPPPAPRGCGAKQTGR